MTDYYRKLEELSLSGELEILYILSPPRTLSTILEIALAEYGDGQIHEPFHKRSRRDFNEGCRIIYERVLHLQEQQNKRHIKIVVKDISKYISTEEWRRLVKLTSRVIFTIREPSRQLFSLASRYANDLDGVEDQYGLEQIIANIPRMPFEDLAWNYWENLLSLLETTKAYFKDKHSRNKQVAIISSATFRYDVPDSIRKLLVQLDMNLEPQKIMKDWTVGRGENFFQPGNILKNAIVDKDIKNGPWLGLAINSTSFAPLDPKKDAPLDIDIYDYRLRSYFAAHIMPVYVTIYLDSNNVCKPDEDVVLSKEFLKSTLTRANSIEALLLTRSYTPSDAKLSEVQKHNEKYLERLIEDEYPYIAKIFRI